MTMTREQVAALAVRLQNFAQGCRESMWQSRAETISLCDAAADALLAALDDLNAQPNVAVLWQEFRQQYEDKLVAAEAANAALTARNEALVGALEFYADETGWNQPPVQTREGLLSVEYESQASKVRKDRGKIARAAIRANAGEG